jgi:hypothetical protein
MHHQLLGYLLGALDDNEQRSVEARLEYDAEWRHQLMHWRQQVVPLAALRPDFEPPAGLAERTCRYVADCRLALCCAVRGGDGDFEGRSAHVQACCPAGDATGEKVRRFPC